MIEDWIDELADVWMGINLSGFGNVYSPYLVRDAKYPSSIDPKDLANQVIALNVPQAFNPGDYGRGSPKRAFWRGVTQFHLAPNGDMGTMHRVIAWHGKILAAAAKYPTLNGKVELFWIPNQDDAVMLGRNYSFGDETPHWAILVKWIVKEPYDAAYRGWLS